MFLKNYRTFSVKWKKGKYQNNKKQDKNHDLKLKKENKKYEKK